MRDTANIEVDELQQETTSGSTSVSREHEPEATVDTDSLKRFGKRPGDNFPHRQRSLYKNKHKHTTH